MKNPKALLLNDIHVSKDTIDEFRKNWNEALEICDENGIKHIIIGGDLWQTRSSQTLDTLLAVRDAILQAHHNGIKLITIAEGNHCKVDQESVFGYSHLFSHYQMVDVVDVYNSYRLGDTAMIYVMSYFPENGSFKDKLSDIVRELSKDMSNILYIHEGISGALSVPNEHELPANLFKDFDKVLVGHYHDRCVIKGTNIEYIGASRQHNFGEDEEKGYTILYDDGSVKFIKNKVNIRYKVIDVDAKEVDSELLKDIEDVKAGGKYKIKLKISCDSTEVSTIDKQRLMDSGVSKVEIIQEETDSVKMAAHALEQKFDKSGIKKEYVDFCSSKGVGNVEFGLKYLDKIN